MKRKILKKAMSTSYCGGTRFDYLDKEEIPMIYKAMEEYHNAKLKLLGVANVSNRRELFDKFYEWLDGLSQAEYDDMSLTDKCEKFFFNT